MYNAQYNFKNDNVCTLFILKRNLPKVNIFWNSSRKKPQQQYKAK